MSGTPQCPKDDSRIAEGQTFVPRPAYFDAALEGWVFSSYADVQAAFHEPNLCLVGPHGEGSVASEDRAAAARTRIETLAALSAAKLAEWEAEFAGLADKIVTALPDANLIDVAGEFARPWSLALAVRVTGAEPVDAERLAALAAKVTDSTADPENAALKAPAAAASAELDLALKHSSQPMAGAAFVALSQTIPCLLANAWLVLLDRPEELERLRKNAALLPRAVDELLRIAGLARTLHRQAIEDVTLGQVEVKSGQHVHLLVEAANHDAAQFPEPEALDFSRRGSGHFALGAGSHSCAAAGMIRMAMGVATGTFVRHFTVASTRHPVEWCGGSAFRWPARVFAQRLQE